mmetsp:Transcript_41932/g.57196  ORF Transcript_41932/g.57196 Transcript_41932/m.57196 type:complete len:80 (-) Transcript_41932:109-348(-)
MPPTHYRLFGGDGYLRSSSETTKATDVSAVQSKKLPSFHSGFQMHDRSISATLRTFRCTNSRGLIQFLSSSMAKNEFED